MISKRGNRYGVRVWDKTSQTMRWIGSYDTREDAQYAEARATLKPRRGQPITVTEFAGMWLSDYARDAPATQRNYRYGSKRVIDDLGGLMLSDVDRPLARKMAKQWPRASTRVARTMFADAMRDGLIDHNPFSDLRLETPRGRKDLTALTEPQILELSQIAESVHGQSYGPEAAAIIITLAYVGCRPGELCSLRWADLDRGRRRLTIRFNTDATGVEKPPKNGLARVVSVAPIVIQALDRIVWSTATDDRIFHTTRGRPFTKGTLAYFWRPISVGWVQAGGERISLYHLRHACATLLLERGLQPWDVAVQLGHQDGGRLVQQLYGHPEDDHALERADMVLNHTPAASGDQAVEQTTRTRRAG